MSWKIYNTKNPAEVWNSYWQGKAVHYEVIKVSKFNLLKTKILLEMLSYKGRILECGCGLGRWVVFLTQRKYNIIGLDKQFEVLKKVKAYDDGVDLTGGDVLVLPFKNSTFDVCISNGVIEHFEEGPQDALKQMHYVLKKDGLVFISVPALTISRRIKQFVYWIKKIMKSILVRSRKTKLYFCQHYYTIKELRHYVRNAGFEILRVYPDDWYGSKNYRIGLYNDYGFLRSNDGEQGKLNFLGRFISLVLESISPWISCGSMFLVCRALNA